MTFVVAWLAFPVLVLALALGAGLLVERIGGHPLPGTLRFGAGFTALVAVTQLATVAGVARWLGPAVAVLVALAGYVAGRPGPADRWAVALAGAVFLSFAAPALLTGHPTFLGYSNLGDASIHFELVDRWMGHGPSVHGLADSSYRESLRTYFETSYPTGAHTVLGSVRALTGVDVAWVFQPYLTCLVAIAALTLHALIRPFVRSRALAALVAFAAIQATLVYSYVANQQALKELAALVCIATAAGLVGPLLRAPRTWRSGLPIAVATGGALGVLSLALAPWFGPLLLAGGAGVLLRRPRRGALPTVAGFTVLAIVLALPALAHLRAFVRVSNVSLTTVTELGNLPRPLPFVEGLGVWPASDFRGSIDLLPDAGYVLLGVFALAALTGLIEAVRRGAWPVVLFGTVSLVGFLAVAGRASPWAYGKALMLLAPAVVLLAATSAALRWETARRLEALLIGTALAVGLVWTNAQTFHNVDAAPYDRMSELAEIGDDYAGRGPAVYFESEEYAKHFLHKLDPTGAVESLRPDWPTNDGRPPRFGFSSDVDDWSASSLAEHFKLLVTRRGPAASRPPSGWVRDRRGAFYDVWRRALSAPRVLEHVRLGGRLDAAAVPRCSTVRRLAGEGGRLGFVERPAATIAHVTGSPAPTGWTVDPGDAETWRPVGQGIVRTTVTVPRGGAFRVWLEGSVGRAVHVSIDRSEVGVVRNELNPRLSSLAVGRVDLAAGRHAVSVFVEGGSLDPRAGGANRLIGPVTLVPDTDLETIATLPSSKWRELCGRSFDWLEAIT